MSVSKGTRECPLPPFSVAPLSFVRNFCLSEWDLNIFFQRKHTLRTRAIPQVIIGIIFSCTRFLLHLPGISRHMNSTRPTHRRKLVKSLRVWRVKMHNCDPFSLPLPSLKNLQLRRCRVKMQRWSVLCQHDRSTHILHTHNFFCIAINYYYRIKNI